MFTQAAAFSSAQKEVEERRSQTLQARRFCFKPTRLRCILASATCVEIHPAFVSNYSDAKASSTMQMELEHLAAQQQKEPSQQSFGEETGLHVRSDRLWRLSFPSSARGEILSEFSKSLLNKRTLCLSVRGCMHACLYDACLYVCLYACLCVCMSACMWEGALAMCMCRDPRMCMCMCMCICLCTCTRARVCVCLSVYVYVYIVYLYIYMVPPRVIHQFWCKSCECWP